MALNVVNFHGEDALLTQADTSEREGIGPGPPGVLARKAHVRFLKNWDQHNHSIVCPLQKAWCW